MMPSDFLSLVKDPETVLCRPCSGMFCFFRDFLSHFPLSKMLAMMRFRHELSPIDLSHKYLHMTNGSSRGQLQRARVNSRFREKAREAPSIFSGSFLLCSVLRCTRVLDLWVRKGNWRRPRDLPLSHPGGIRRLTRSSNFFKFLFSRNLEISAFRTLSLILL